jgi:diguanylate cyclase (GGDEF)-like protein
MEFNEFRDSISIQWQKKLMKLCWWGTLVIFVMEAAVFAAFYHTNSFTSTIANYITLRIALPSGCNLMAAVVAAGILRSNRFTVGQKNMAVCSAVYILCSVVSVFHSYYKFLLVAEGLPIIISSGFADKKLLKRIFSLCLFTYALSIVAIWFDDIRMTVVDFTATAVCAFLFLLIINAVARSILTYQTEQINFIWLSSQRQTELIHELKIEPLTKLYNRTALNEAMRAFVRKFNEGVYVPHLVLVDVDNYKQILNEYGHTAADRVLIKLASIIKINMGGIRRTFRYSTDIFVLLFETASAEEVFKEVDLIRTQLEQSSFDFAPGRKITVSAGIAGMRPNWDDTTWFSAADTALYHAKETGRNKVAIAEE